MHSKAEIIVHQPVSCHSLMGQEGKKIIVGYLGTKITTKLTILLKLAYDPQHLALASTLCVN